MDVFGMVAQSAVISQKRTTHFGVKNLKEIKLGTKKIAEF